MATKTKAFFAHSQKTYGTPQERQALVKIKTLFDVVDPYHDIYKKNPQAKNEDYNKGIDECGCVVILEFRGFIGKGVYTNVSYALRNKYPVYVFDVAENILRPVREVTIHDPNDWAIKYATVQTKNLEIL